MQVKSFLYTSCTYDKYFYLISQTWAIVVKLLGISTPSVFVKVFYETNNCPYKVKNDMFHVHVIC